VAVRPSEVAGRGVQPKEWLVMNLYGGGGGNKGRAYTHMYTIYVYVCTYMYVFVHLCIRTLWGSAEGRTRCVPKEKGGG